MHWGFQATWLPLRALYALLLRTGDIKEMAVEGLGLDSWLKKVFFFLFLAVYVFVLFCFFFTVFFYLLAGFHLITFRPHNSLTSCFLVNVFLVTLFFLQVLICTSLQQHRPVNSKNCPLLWKSDNFSLSEQFTMWVSLGYIYICV